MRAAHAAAAHLRGERQANSERQHARTRAFALARPSASAPKRQRARALARPRARAIDRLKELSVLAAGFEPATLGYETHTLTTH